jgi:DNA-binding winged helix-turn-helix (wHTH) protein
VSGRQAASEIELRQKATMAQRVAARRERRNVVIRYGVLAPLMDTQPARTRYRFGEYELDGDGAELRRNGTPLRLQPQPCKLLLLLVRRSGTLVTREEIRQELWADGTHVDFDQAVNFCVKQIRDALRDQSDRPLYIQTLPRRGYKFIAPVDVPREQTARREPSSDGNTVRLQKALWANIAELKLAEERRRRNTRVGAIVLMMVVLGGAALFFALT